MHPIWQATWRYTAEKSLTNATIVTKHSHMQAIWRDIWKRTVLKNASNDFARLFLGWHFEETFENTCSKLCSLLTYSLMRHLKPHKSEDQKVMKHPLKQYCERVFDANVHLDYLFIIFLTLHPKNYLIYLKAVSDQPIDWQDRCSLSTAQDVYASIYWLSLGKFWNFVQFWNMIEILEFG